MDKAEEEREREPVTLEEIKGAAKEIKNKSSQDNEKLSNRLIKHGGRISSGVWGSFLMKLKRRSVALGRGKA